MIEVLILKLGDLSDPDYAVLYNRLTTNLKNRVDQYVYLKDKKAFIMGRLLLTVLLLSKDFDLEKMDEKIYRNVFNRPCIYDAGDFNISHSGDYVICAYSPDGKIGVDVEEIKPMNLADFDRILTSAERNLVLNAADHCQAFYKLWVRKESVLKAHGEGLSIPLKEVEIINNKEVRLKGQNWYINDFFLDIDYSSCLASDQRISNYLIRRIYPYELVLENVKLFN